MEWLLVISGLGLLAIGGNTLVSAAIALAKLFGTSPLFISLTVIAFGTSAPELLVMLRASLSGAVDLGLGNIIGSNITNILLILGLPALMSGLSMRNIDCQSNYIIMIFCSLIFIALCHRVSIDLFAGLLLLAIFALISWYIYKKTISYDQALEKVAAEISNVRLGIYKMLFYLAVGLISLPVGADLLIKGATQIVQIFDISQEVIGLTLVAIGTSLPELATTISAALRRHPDVAIGNVIGSNIFNILVIPGICALFTPLVVSVRFLHFDLWIMLATSLLLMPFILVQWNLTRLWGLIFTAAYGIYIFILFG